MRSTVTSQVRITENPVAPPFPFLPPFIPYPRSPYPPGGSYAVSPPSTSRTEKNDNSGAAIVLIVFGVLTAVLVLCCVINACNRKSNGDTQTGERDGDMVVVDGAQAAEAAVEIQQGCCCGGGGGGGGDGDGGGCGGCGGD